MAQNVKKLASKNLKKPKVSENSKSCQNSIKLPKISKVAEKLPSNLWLSLQMGWGSYLFVHLKMGACIKFYDHFMYFCAFEFPLYKKETTLKESTTRQILFIIKMMACQTNITCCIAMLSQWKNKLYVLLSIIQYHCPLIHCLKS